MWQLKPAVLVIVTAATLVWSAERPIKQRHSKMTRLWRQESGLGSFSDVGTAGGNAIAKPVALQCTEAGYFPQPGTCNAFYRCVDWMATGKYFSVFRFNCPYGTVFDDDLDICNHPGAVRNPPECAGAAAVTPPLVQPGSSASTGGTGIGIGGSPGVGDQQGIGFPGSQGGVGGTGTQGGAGGVGGTGFPGSQGGVGGTGTQGGAGGVEGTGFPGSQGGVGSTGTQGGAGGQGGSGFPGSQGGVGVQGGIVSTPGVTGSGGSVPGSETTIEVPGPPSSGSTGSPGGAGSPGEVAVGGTGSGASPVPVIPGDVGVPEGKPAGSGISVPGSEPSAVTPSGITPVIITIGPEGSGSPAGSTGGTTGSGTPGTTSGSPGATSGSGTTSGPGTTSGSTGTTSGSAGSASGSSTSGSVGPVGTQPPPFTLTCHHDSRYRRHPLYCNQYYYCLWDGNNWTFPVFTCPAALAFDEATQQCSYPDDTEPCNGTLAPEPQPVTTTPSGTESTTGAVTTFTLGTSPATQATTLAPGPSEPETTVASGPWIPETTLVPGPSTESTLAPGSSTETTLAPVSSTEATSVPGLLTEATTLMPGPVEEGTLPTGLVTEGTTLSPGLPDVITPEPTDPSTTEDSQTTPSSSTTTSGTVWEVDATSIYPCPAPGYYPFEGDCVRFYKCVETDAGMLKGLLYKCPNGFGYSEEKKRCARLEDLPPCLRQPQEAHQRFENATPIYPEDLIWFFNNKK